MKPDGVATAVHEPMETLESNPVNEAAGLEGNQDASPGTEEVSQPTIEETGDAKPNQAKETPAKTGNKTTGDPKAKTTNKAPSNKTKPGTTAPSKTSTGSKTNTTQSRLSNGTTKPQTNGVAKKPAPAAVKKTTPTTAPVKKPTGTTPTPTPALKSKVGEKKPTGASPATDGVKSMTGTIAAKRPAPAPANGVKTSSTTAAPAKKPLAPKTASATPTKPPVSKTTRTPTGTPASSRPATAPTRTPTSSTAKSSPATPKTTTPKTSSTTTAKPAASKLTSTTPSGGKPPASQTSRTTTPVKKDVTKPAASASKKPSDSPLTRPPITKSAKPEAPKSASKSDVPAKKPAASKDTKTPTRPKTESKPTPSKAPGLKTSKTPAPKKTVGSSTPTPVKRGPKAVSEAAPAKEIAATVAAAAAIATAAAVIVGPEGPEPAAAGEPQLMSSRPEAVQEKTPEPTPEPEPESFQVRETSPEPLPEPLSDAELGAASVNQLSADLDRFKFSESAKDTSLGTTVMSPPSSPLCPASSLLDMQVQADPWDRNQDMAPSHFAPQSLVYTEEEKENKDQFETQQDEEEEEEEEEEEKENLFMPSSKAPSAGAFNLMAQPQMDALLSPHEKEEAVEKADEEINEDDEEEDDEDEEQRRLGHLPSPLGTDMSTSQPSEEFAVRPSAFGGSAGWHGDDLLSGLDSEDVSSCSRPAGESDLSSTQHTALLEGTQSSDALVDSSLRGSEGDGNLMGSPNVETLANEEEEDEEDEERVDDMDLSSERVEEHHKGLQQQQQQQQEEEEDDEDVEMHSEGVTESGGNVDEDDFNEEERLDNLNRSAAPPCDPPTSSWGQTNPFCDTWAQSATVPSPRPLSGLGAAESVTPVLSPAHMASSAASFAPESVQEEMMKDSEDDEAHGLFAAAAGGAAPVARSNSETSTPEELRDYDSSSGVESRSDKQQTPVPPHQADMEQDLGIHLEKGDGEEEEAETLPADEVLGMGPPTAPASAPSSPSTSGDEASDTEGEMQINDPDAPLMMDESARFESPPPTCSLPALTEDEEARGGEGEEDGGGTTPQSANSVASYGFDCTTSNSNAHSMAESCGKSPGIFSLENEEQLSEEAKDPSLIKELTLPSSAAAAAPVDLTPFGFPGDVQHGSLDEYMLGGEDGGGAPGGGRPAGAPSPPRGGRGVRRPRRQPAAVLLYHL
ncbi:hypothetical protein OYC64_006587 [Pagothenia borchgrevinki]|uniref:Uncharacterized protein n=1 Tax=Pagothenia borchgrevinki TaxID=8213 RepID=A0ABD2GK70_PAGBO